MKVKELSMKTKEQLLELLSQFKKESLNLRFQKVTGELSNTARIQQVRKTIARINTLLNVKHMVKEGNNA